MDYYYIREKLNKESDEALQYLTGEVDLYGGQIIFHAHWDKEKAYRFPENKVGPLLEYIRSVNLLWFGDLEVELCPRVEPNPESWSSAFWVERGW